LNVGGTDPQITGPKLPKPTRLPEHGLAARSSSGDEHRYRREAGLKEAPTCINTS
jgi:hypothetical protein